MRLSSNEYNSRRKEAANLIIRQLLVIIHHLSRSFSFFVVVFDLNLLLVWPGMCIMHTVLENIVKVHLCLVHQVIDENSLEEDASTLMNLESGEMPLLVYVAREKRPSHPHNFKVGALNVLVRNSLPLS